MGQNYRLCRGCNWIEGVYCAGGLAGWKENMSKADGHVGVQSPFGSIGSQSCGRCSASLGPLALVKSQLPSDVVAGIH
jgi:hypothetical protein